MAFNCDMILTTNFSYMYGNDNNIPLHACITESQSQDSSSKPTKLVSMVTCVKGDEGGKKVAPKTTHLPVTRPSSDGVMYGHFNERRIEYEEVLLSERSDSQYSQSESYLSERYVQSCVGLLYIVHVLVPCTLWYTVEPL